MRPKASATVIVVGVVAMFCVVVVAIVALAIFSPKDTDVANLVTILLGSLGSTVAVLATLAKVADVDSKVNYLTNGGMDSKVRAGVADVVRDDLLDPAVADQLEADRANRAAGPRGNGSPS